MYLLPVVFCNSVLVTVVLLCGDTITKTVLRKNLAGSFLTASELFHHHHGERNMTTLRQG